MLSMRSCQRFAAGQAVLQHELAGERQDERQRDRGDRARHRHRRIGDEDAGAGHGGDVDRVVADAVPRDDAQAAIAARDRGGRRARRVDVERVVARGVIGRELRHDLGQVLPLECGRGVEDRERLAAERGLAARVEDVAGDADAELCRHCVISRSLTQNVESVPQRLLQHRLVDAVRITGESRTPCTRAPTPSSVARKAAVLPCASHAATMRLTPAR